MTYDFFVTNSALEYFQTRSSRFWIGGIAVCVVASVIWPVIRRWLPVALGRHLMFGGACTLSMLAAVGAFVLVWAISSADLQLGSTEIMMFVATILMLAFLAVSCWIAYCRVRKSK